MIALTSLFNISCEKELKSELEGGGGALAVFAFIQPDSGLQVSMSKSVSILSSNSYSIVEDGRFTVAKNGAYMGAYSFPDDTINASWQNVTFTYGDSIGFKFFVDDNLIASAETSVPIRVEMKGVDTVRVKEMDAEGEERTEMRLSVQFSDPEFIANYYQLVIELNKEVQVNGEFVKVNELISYPKTDLIFTNPNQGSSSIGSIDFQGLFTDYNIDGENYTIEVDLPIDYFESEENQMRKEIQVSLYHLSYDYYAYTHSRIISNTYDGVPIFDPVKIHSNVRGAFGLVSGLSSSSEIIKVEN